MTETIEHKKRLRSHLRKLRREHAENLPREVSALVFSRPPAPVLARIPEGATIGIYRADPGEAPTERYVSFFHERGHPIARPRVTTLGQPMEFRLHANPLDEDELEDGPLGLRQPPTTSPLVVPDVLFMPLVGFTTRGERIGQGGGFYDRYLAAHPEAHAIGLAWDVQEVPELPLEPHDHPLDLIVTPTRVLGPFGAQF